ncbi:hypothetical protein FRB94_002760 [Tulasnella sp. JGI-2019a]|nr:hypothetical protein FRB94_002760 [Tulasnella sp. JGI-2019a]KAG9012382.1 hypothetical protein FRB93_001805 [Tulasnella sp. JGI-2019a]
MPPKRKAQGLASFVTFLTEPSEPNVTPVARAAQQSASTSASLEHVAKPVKKQKRTGLLGEGYESIDATGMVPFYQQASEAPQQLKKYFAQRQRFFSLYSEGCLLDEEGWYSVTPERIADQIAERCRCDTILDAFCGVGGNAIAFAKTCERVIALDTSPVRIALARHNAAIYGVENRIEFIVTDYLTFARAYNTLPPNRRTIEAVFLSPPWGGPEYISSPQKGGTAVQDDGNGDVAGRHPVFSLDSILPIPGSDLFALTSTISSNIAYYLPRNVDLNEIAALSPKNKVEVEEEWMGDKLKAVTCYYGGLASGQEHLF